MKCNECGTEHNVVALHSRCHIEAPAWAWFNEDHKALTLWCAECSAPIATFTVSGARNVEPGDPGPDTD